MCMLFGFTGDKSYDLSKIISAFLKNSTRHPHGWGIASYNNGFTLVKEAKAAYKSNYSRITAESISSNLVIAHIRYATIGEKSYLNTHPFIQDINNTEWVLAHNGSIKSPILNVVSSHGDTDSEKILSYLKQELNKNINYNSLQSKVKCVERVIKELSCYGKLNLLISDGEYLYIHSNYRNSLYQYNLKERVFFATKPIEGILNNGKWENVQLNTLLVYKNGKRIYTGIPHHNEYIKKKGVRLAWI